MSCCSRDDCEKSVHSRGLCQPHYRQERRREDDPLVGTRKRGPKQRAVQVAPTPDRPAPVKVDHRRMTAEEKAARRQLRNAKTQCFNGHELNSVNSYVRDGKKVCRLCQRRYQQRHLGRPETPDTVPLALRNGNKTHCPAGHAYAEHGYVKPGARGCRLCDIDNRKRRIYGVTAEQFAEKLTAQENVCAICMEAFKDARDTHIDHDHATGDVRGILCGRCNLGLGNYKDDPDLLRLAADYLDYHRALRCHNGAGRDKEITT